MTSQTALIFDAVVTPNRSLSPDGFRRLMLLLAVGLAAPSLIALAHGWYPILMFCGGEFLLVWYLFQRNYFDGRATELVRLDDRQLIVERITPKGDRSVLQLEPTWLSVRMDDPPRHDSLVRLASHGAETIIARDLSPAERLEFARSLDQALSIWRMPDHLRGPALAAARRRSGGCSGP